MQLDVMASTDFLRRAGYLRKSSRCGASNRSRSASLSTMKTATRMGDTHRTLTSASGAAANTASRAALSSCVPPSQEVESSTTNVGGAENAALARMPLCNVLWCPRWMPGRRLAVRSPAIPGRSSPATETAPDRESQRQRKTLRSALDRIKGLRRRKPGAARPCKLVRKYARVTSSQYHLASSRAAEDSARSCTLIPEAHSPPKGWEFLTLVFTYLGPPLASRCE
jgi:hypothetical protein